MAVLNLVDKPLRSMCLSLRAAETRHSVRRTIWNQTAIYFAVVIDGPLFRNCLRLVSARLSPSELVLRPMRSARAALETLRTRPSGGRLHVIATTAASPRASNFFSGLGLGSSFRAERSSVARAVAAARRAIDSRNAVPDAPAALRGAVSEFRQRLRMTAAEDRRYILRVARGEKGIKIGADRIEAQILAGQGSSAVASGLHSWFSGPASACLAH